METKRQALDDGGWFDKSQAVCFDEDLWWNGSNQISQATGSQWNHEELYITCKGRFVLHFWSQMQGTPDRWTEISSEQAVQWLIKNKCDADAAEKLPELRALFDTALAETEV